MSTPACQLHAHPTALADPYKTYCQLSPPGFYLGLHRPLPTGFPYPCELDIHVHVHITNPVIQQQRNTGRFLRASEAKKIHCARWKMTMWNCLPPYSEACSTGMPRLIRIWKIQIPSFLKPHGNHMQKPHVLICLLNLKFAWIEIFFFRIKREAPATGIPGPLAPTPLSVCGTTNPLTQ